MLNKSIAKATPSLHRAQSCSYVIQNIPEDSLSEPTTDSHIGSGRFGTCVHMIYKGMYCVCMKAFSEGVTLAQIKSEAGIM